MPARAPSPTEPRTRRKTGRRLASVPRLRAFLEHPARPAGTLACHELRGFLFAAVNAPEFVRPSEWLPLILKQQVMRLQLVGARTVEASTAGPKAPRGMGSAPSRDGGGDRHTEINLGL